MKLTPEQVLQQLQLYKGAAGKLPQDMGVSLDEIESFGNIESLKEMLTDIGKYNKMLQERITLINPTLSAVIPFTRENLYLFCAYTGSGKSTVAANISHPLWKQNKKTLIISNEESKQDILFRIAALELGLNFNAYKKGAMSGEEQKRAISLFPEISKLIKVIDVNYKNGLTTKIEGVKNALEAVKKEEGYSCVLIDYFQLIKFSAEDKTKSSYENLNDFRVWLGQYIKGSTMPVVLFAQLYSLSKKGGAKDIDSRLKECTSIVEPATVIVELIPNFEDRTTAFCIMKDRFGRAGHKVTCRFENGKYIDISDAEAMQLQNSSIANNIQAKIKSYDNT